MCYLKIANSIFRILWHPFYVIRNQADVIRSIYSRIAPELGRSLTYNGETLIQYIKTNKANQPIIERFLSGFKYYEIYKNLSDSVGKNKIRFFLYEKFHDNNETLGNLSNYLKIDPNISIKLLKDRREYDFNSIFEENYIFLWRRLYSIISLMAQNKCHQRVF